MILQLNHCAPAEFHSQGHATWVVQTRWGVTARERAVLKGDMEVYLEHDVARVRGLRSYKARYNPLNTKQSELGVLLLRLTTNTLTTISPIDAYNMTEQLGSSITMPCGLVFPNRLIKVRFLSFPFPNCLRTTVFRLGYCSM